MKSEREKKESIEDVIFSTIDELIERKEYMNRNGTANLYKATRRCLERFFENELSEKAEVELVSSFITFLENRLLSLNTINSYVSVLRVVCHICVEKKRLPEIYLYSFHNLKFHPVPGYKRSISSEVIVELANLDLRENFKLELARDLFLFSFMACGIPFIDLAHLTHGNIKENMLVYHRIKTKAQISISITAAMRFLLNKYADSKSLMLFPILQSPDVSYGKYRVVLRVYNRYLEQLGNLLSVPVKLSSYVPRHSWAMRAKEQAVAVAVIGQALGHTSEKTTIFYLNHLDQSVMCEANQKVIGFIENSILKCD